MKEPYALVTGNAGFIGSNLTNRLLKEGWKVDGVDDLSSGNVNFVSEQINNFYDEDFVSQYVLNDIKRKKYTHVFHLAARPRVGYSVENPSETNDNNVGKTVKLLESCIGNIDRFINTSSSSVYGDREESELPAKEHLNHKPVSPYALQKSITEQYCRMFSKLYNLNTVSVRPFNVFGPNQLGNSSYATAVSSWLYAIKHNLPLRFDGTGEQLRDMTYVDNVVDVFYRVAIMTISLEGSAFNAGTGTCISNNEVLKKIMSIYPDCKIVNAPERPGDVKKTLASIQKAWDWLSYKPIVTFDEGFELTRNWAMSSDLF